MKAKTKQLIKKMEKQIYRVVRVTKTEFELENGDVYPHILELDEDITIEAFQEILDSSKSMLLNHIKGISKDNE